MACRCSPYGCLKDLCIFREESNFGRCFMFILQPGNSASLLGGSDAPWYCGKSVIWPGISLWPGWQFWAISAVTSRPRLRLSCSYSILWRCLHYPGVKAPAPRRCQEQRCFHLSQGQAYAKILTDCGGVSVAFSALILGLQLQTRYI